MVYQLKPIGTVRHTQSGSLIALEPAYIPGLQALEGFRHIQVLWWFSQCDDPSSRSSLHIKQPYRNAPDVMGVFATRSPARPNPIAITTCEIIGFEPEKGVVRVAYIDADEGSPVLDIKPYTPSLDRVEAPGVPAWCAGWPASTEASGDFDWEQVFLF